MLSTMDASKIVPPWQYWAFWVPSVGAIFFVPVLGASTVVNTVIYAFILLGASTGAYYLGVEAGSAEEPEVVAQ